MKQRRDRLAKRQISQKAVTVAANDQKLNAFFFDNASQLGKGSAVTEHGFGPQAVGLDMLGQETNSLTIAPALLVV